MNFSIRPIYSLLLLFLILGCSQQERSDESGSESSERAYLWMKPSHVVYPKLSKAYVNDKKAAIERFCDKYFRNENNSVSLLVAKNGQIIYERYQGVADKNKGTKILQNTPLHIASVSKVFTATAVLLLIDKKKIELDQKVNTILLVLVIHLLLFLQAWEWLSPPDSKEKMTESTLLSSVMEP